MKAVLLNGKTVEALEYGTATVTLKGATRPVEMTWSEIDRLIGDDGLMRQRELVEGIPTIVAQPLKPPPSVKYDPPPVQIDLLTPQPQRISPRDDVEDAKEMLDLVDDEVNLMGVYWAIKEAFKRREKELWHKLNEDQKMKLKKGQANADKINPKNI